MGEDGWVCGFPFRLHGFPFVLIDITLSLDAPVMGSGVYCALPLVVEYYCILIIIIVEYLETPRFSKVDFFKE